MRYRILDLETVPHPEAKQWAEPVKADSRLKDPVKIEADLKEKSEKQAEDFGLDADLCRIVALGFHDVGHAEPTVHLMRDEFEERQLLIDFWESWSKLDQLSWREDSRGAALVTYNGARFDLPVLIMRSLYLDVKHPELVIAPEWKSPHIDIYQKLSLGGARDRRDVKGLKFYAKRFGIGTLDKVDGSEIAKLAAEEKWADIEAHCLSDIGLTHALANRLKLLKLAPVAA